MKVLFLLGNLSGGGGTERVACTLASALAARGDDVTILSVFGPAEPVFNLTDNVSTSSLGLLEARGDPVQVLKISCSIVRSLRQRAPDVVIAVDSILFSFLVPILFQDRQLLVCWEHFHLNTSHGSSLRTVGRSVAARMADRIVVLTPRDSEAWKSRYGSALRVEDIPNAVPSLVARTRGVGQTDGRHVLLAAGRMTRQKGFDILLEAWARVAPRRPEWRLRILGDGEERAALEEQITLLNLEDTVEMPGRVRDMASEYSAADGFVMSSRWEGLPMVLLEAQQAGLPIVSTDCETGPREILRNGGGLLVPVDDSFSLGAALARLTGDHDLRAALSTTATINGARYLIDDIAERWWMLLRRLAAERLRH